MNDSATWTLDGNYASLACGPLHATVALDSTGGALVAQAWNGVAVSGVVVLSYRPGFRTAELPLTELYARGGDLVARYGQAGPQRLAPLIYWRAQSMPAAQAVQVELVVSVETDLLDSQPAALTSSLFSEGGQVWHAPALEAAKFTAVGPAIGQQPPLAESALAFDSRDSREHLFVIRRQQLGCSYAEMVHPSDFVSSDVHADRSQPLSIFHKLFPDRLEKGVIRRGRVCGWFLPAENDLAVAAELARQFVAEPLPLTA